MNKYLSIGVISLAILMLGGCGLIHVFANQEEARKYVLSSMEERYGEVFTILEKEHYTSYPLYGDVYICEVAPEEDKEKITFVRVTQRGELSDSWATYLFNDEVAGDAREKLVETEDIKIKSVLLMAPHTQRLWKKEDGIEKYLQESGAYLEIVATCEEGLSYSKYTEIIEEFLKPIYELNVNTEVSVKVGRTYIFFKNIYVLGESKTEPFTKEAIEKEVEEGIKWSPFLEKNEKEAYRLIQDSEH